ncbi:unannotated protein [freshwater metagenome]|uniref:Unannotated protein n=1 Tax=freshwater metagenome TaxID=449393 RepID=A0A6J6ARQ1_9ZZZZ
MAASFAVEMVEEQPPAEVLMDAADVGLLPVEDSDATKRVIEGHVPNSSVPPRESIDCLWWDVGSEPFIELVDLIGNFTIAIPVEALFPVLKLLNQTGFAVPGLVENGELSDRNLCHPA